MEMFTHSTALDYTTQEKCQKFSAVSSSVSLELSASSLFLAAKHQTFGPAPKNFFFEVFLKIFQFSVVEF